jgi:putative oxidoreductase
MNSNTNVGASFLLGRLLVGGLYLSAGIQNLLNLEGQAAYAASKGVQLAGPAVVIASLLLLVGGSSILTGFRPRLGVLAIACFLIPVTFLMHGFWHLQGIQRVAETYRFLGNLGLLGSALLFLAIPRPWPFGLDDAAALGGALRNRLDRPGRRPASAG